MFTGRGELAREHGTSEAHTARGTGSSQGLTRHSRKDTGKACCRTSVLLSPSRTNTFNCWERHQTLQSSEQRQKPTAASEQNRKPYAPGGGAGSQTGATKTRGHNAHLKPRLRTENNDPCLHQANWNWVTSFNSRLSEKYPE